ncbi:unnamed protein product [Prunus armeniaca]
MVFTQFHAQVKVFRTDNGGEYVNSTLASFFCAQGFIHQTTTPFTPQQNGVFECKNRQLLEVARSLMLDMSVPHHLWGNAVLSAAYLINHTPSRVLDFKTPHDVFGDHVSLVLISKLPHKVFGGRGGSELENNVFEDAALGKETTCRTEASDQSPISEDETCGPCEEMTDCPLELDQSPIYEDEAGALGVETTGHTEASDQSLVYENNDNDSCMDEFDAIPPSVLPVPQFIRDSESCEDDLSNPKWMDAMNVEMDALNKNKTWDLVPLPQGKKVVRCRWVFILKHKADGYIDRYKARLEKIYMDLPPGIPVTSKEGVVCKLQKSLYGLKQSPGAGFGRFAASMKKFGYVQSNPDHTLFLKRHKGKLIALIIYVDDMIVTGDDQAEMQNLQKYLASEFEMKSLGDLKYFLEIEVARYKHVSVVSQFMHSPSEDHMSVVMCILRYLKVTPGKGLMFCKYGHTDVEGYTDADRAGSVIDRRSTSGYFTFVGGNLVTWRSKKQKVVSRFSAKAEYRGMAQGVCELLWLRRLLRDLGFGPQKPMDLYCDNKAAIAIAHNPVQYDRTKHVEVDRHFVKEKLDAEIIYFPFISFEYQLADVLTKAVSTMVFLNLLDKLGMCDIFAPT